MAKNAPAPQISVIIPAHNEDRFIGRAIRSVLNQTVGGGAWNDHYSLAFNRGSRDINSSR